MKTSFGRLSILIFSILIFIMAFINAFLRSYNYIIWLIVNLRASAIYNELLVFCKNIS